MSNDDAADVPLGGGRRPRGTDGSAEYAALAGLVSAFRDMELHSTRLLIRQQNAFGLDSTQVRGLFFLASHGEKGATPKALSVFLGLTSGAVTNVIDRTVNGGLIARTVHPTDRRSLILQTTPEGFAVVAAITDSFRHALSAAIPAEDVGAVTGLFRIVGGALACAIPASADNNPRMGG